MPSAIPALPTLPDKLLRNGRLFAENPNCLKFGSFTILRRCQILSSLSTPGTCYSSNTWHQNHQWSYGKLWPKCINQIVQEFLITIRKSDHEIQLMLHLFPLRLLFLFSPAIIFVHACQHHLDALVSQLDIRNGSLAIASGAVIRSLVSSPQFP